MVIGLIVMNFVYTRSTGGKTHESTNMWKTTQLYTNVHQLFLSVEINNDNAKRRRWRSVALSSIVPAFLYVK